VHHLLVALPSFEAFILFIGLNNGNGRGSMDSIWYDSLERDL